MLAIGLMEEGIDIEVYVEDEFAERAYKEFGLRKLDG